MNTSGVIQWNKSFQLIVIGLIVIGVIWYKMSSDGVVTMDVKALKTDSKLQEVQVKAVKDFKVTVNGQPISMAYRECSADKPIMDVLFLHGMAFKSETWVSEPVWTLQYLSKLGYRSVAIDLPGYGNSPQADPDPAAFIEAVIKELNLKSPVIVSPSMSGSYSLPYLFKDPANVLSRSKGYVPVAPVTTEKYTVKQYEALQIPALVIYGDRDRSIGPVSVRNLKNLPKSTVVELKGAGHACYMDKPEEFNQHLVSFLKSLQ